MPAKLPLSTTTRPRLRLAGRFCSAGFSPAGGAADPAALAKARAAYQDSLALWKDADPDIPLLLQAKAEYAKLK